MIDDEFTPGQLPLAILGELLLHSEQFPLMPFLRLDDLYAKLEAPEDDVERAIWDDFVEEFEEFGLVKIVHGVSRVGDRIGQRPIDVGLTPSGIYYCISHAFRFAEQEHGLTWDRSDRYSDLTYVISQRFGPSLDQFAPASDRIVEFSDNQKEVASLHEKLDLIISAVSSDNELGADNPFERDERLSKLKELKQALSTPEVRVSAVLYLGYQALIWVAETFAEKPVSFIAEQAWLSLKSLLGI